MIQDDFKYKVNCDGCHKELINPDDEKGMFIANEPENCHIFSVANEWL